MRARPFGLVLAAIVLAGALGSANPVPAQAPAPAQSDSDISALGRQVAELRKAGKYAEAVPLARRYTEAVKARRGLEHPEYASALNDLADLLRAANRLAEAEPLMWRALAISEKSLGPEDPAVAVRLTNLSQLLRTTNRLAEAEPLMRRALAIGEKSQGPDHPAVGTRLNNLADLLRATNRLAEAEPLMRRALAIGENSLGPEHPTVAIRLSNLAGLLRATNRLAEAEPLYRRALAIDEKILGPEHTGVAVRLNNLAELLRATNRLTEAEPLYRRALAINEKILGPEHTGIAVSLNNLAGLLQATNRLAEAEPLYRRALTIDEKILGPEHTSVAVRLNNLAWLLQDTGRQGEAEPLHRRALAINEKSLGPDHPSVAIDLNNLGVLLRNSGRQAEAEPLHRRALAINEKSLGPDHPSVAIDLRSLGILLQNSGRRTEAEALFRRALAINEKSLGPDHPSVATNLNDLGYLLWLSGRLQEAEALYRRALVIYEKSLGPDHPSVALALENIADLAHTVGVLGQQNDYLLADTKALLAGAERLIRRALTIYERSYGPNHPSVARALNSLGRLRAELGDWREGTQLLRRAMSIRTAGRGTSDADSKALRGALEAPRLAVRAVHRTGGNSAQARAEGFELAQWALQSGAADALGQMAVRFAKGGGPLAGLVRERQNLAAQRQDEDKRLLAAVGKADGKAADAVRGIVAEIDAKLDAMDKRLAAEFPEYAGLARPRPLAISAVQDLLKENEVLVVFLDVPKSYTLAEETLAWAVTRREARSISVPLGTAALDKRVGRLRCGLDRDQWAWSMQRRRWMPKGERCDELAPLGFPDGEALPFDFKSAHELYAALLGPFADMIRGKHLLVVPSGPLTSLPLHVLVTSPPSDAAPTSPAWLALEQAITVLPSVGSLAALRRLPPSQAREPYLAFGNPLLEGDPQVAAHREWAKLARAKESCPLDLESPRLRVAAAEKSTPVLGTIVRGGSINVAALRGQTPLPETADELCRVAQALQALGRERETVWLGARATEGNLKTLSRSGRLARYRVVHFATHGVLAGESEAILNGKAEPALILTPPSDGAAPDELEEDDGLLTASEIAQLNLDADWVVLSACNTAAGEKGDAEALSGLARAFFYAKARTLLVSHWAVGSEAAVKITTGAFDALRADPRIGRAEALRRSLTGLITAGRVDEAHPEYWAPFVLVGEGAG